jgi:hypothetical protein
MKDLCCASDGQTIGQLDGLHHRSSWQVIRDDDWRHDARDADNLVVCQSILIVGHPAQARPGMQQARSSHPRDADVMGW